MAFHDEPGPDRVMFCSVGYARGPETRVYMDGSDAGLSRGEVVAALNDWVVDKDTIAELRAQLADRDAEIERLRADLVWAVRKGVMVGHDENVRPCVWFDVHRGVEFDGTDAGILAALRRAIEGEK